MDFGNESDSDNDNFNIRRGNGGYYNRHNETQIQHLEALFKDCPNPSESQRNQLGRELGLAPQQIRIWLQNKRSQNRVHTERANNAALKEENERFHCEILALQEDIKNTICPTCDGPPPTREQRQHTLEGLKLKSAQLKEEHARLARFLFQQSGRSTPQVTSLLSPQAMDTTVRGFPTEEYTRNVGPFGKTSRGISDLEETLMADTARCATDELVQLVRINEPLWFKSTSNGKYLLNREIYEDKFPKANHCRSSTSRFETSKSGCLVKLKGMQLIEMLSDPNKWVDIFHSLVAKASTIRVLRTRRPADCNGSVQLMHIQLHTLSPVVALREFYILRSCQQIDVGMWVISDVSYDCATSQFTTPSRCWRLPSGCLIEDMSDDFSKVTWVEHIEADDKNLNHQIYRELASTGALFEAERWTDTLQRMCERFTYSAEESTFINGFGAEGMRSMKNLAHRMVKCFYGMLSMPGKREFSHLREVNHSGVQVSIRKTTELGQSDGMIVSVATSLSLPLSLQDVFNLFRDERRRSQWDTLSNDNPVHEIIHIANGSHPGNSISVLQPSTLSANQMLILQESSIDQFGFLLAYAPMDMSTIKLCITGGDPSRIPILPSGIIVSRNGLVENASGASSSTHSSTGSILTLVIQMLACPPFASSNQVDPEFISNIATLLSSTVQRIKVALGCSDTD